MTAKKAIELMNLQVVCINKRLLTQETVYVLDGLTLRKNENGYFYQAILRDIKNGNSLLVCRLEEIAEVKHDM